MRANLPLCFVGLISLATFIWLSNLQISIFPAPITPPQFFPVARRDGGGDMTGSRMFFNRSEAKKWIVVTSIQLPTDDIKRLASLSGWSLVVVGDKKTPADWNLPGVKYLSLEQQESMGFASVRGLPTGSYTRKNAGYLYAIANGAEWIYDTDDDNKPYGKGLEQFDYEDAVSGLRFQDYDPAFRNATTNIRLRLFNPYRHFGIPEMWPRGFPLEYYSQHTHDDMYRLCHTMRSAAVQQGIVHKDPDVDAIYRLLKADPQSGLNVEFNKFAPPVTVAPGTYAPWNSQNTLFHRRAFFGLFLPTSVAFRVTDIWRSFFTQKLLHLLGDSVSFVPVNAVQIRNAHDYIKDFHDEIDVYEKTGELIEFLDNWKCPPEETIDGCTIFLAEEFSRLEFWGEADARLIKLWIADLRSIMYVFPSRRESSTDYLISTEDKGTSRMHNCRRTHIQLGLNVPASPEQPAFARAANALRDYADLAGWCKAAKYANSSDCPLHFTFPSAEELADSHASNPAFRQKLETVLIVTNNYRWRFGIGFQQRFYDAFFGIVIFCGSYDRRQMDLAKDARYPSIRGSINYVDLSEAEMNKGYHGFYCLAKVKDMQLQNVKGYFMASDDVIFNLWHNLDLGVAHQSKRLFGTYRWWPSNFGLPAARRAIQLIQGKYQHNVVLQDALKLYDEGLYNSGYAGRSRTPINATEQILRVDGWMVSDWIYLPANNLTYVGLLSEIFYEAEMYHEIALSKIFYTIPYKAHDGASIRYMWRDRGKWASIYNSSLLALHAVKMSLFANQSAIDRGLFCQTVISTLHHEIFFQNQTEI